jgi:D-alanine-D-alanine ligase
VKKCRVLVLVHKDLVPPETVKKSEVDRDNTEWITEFDVIDALNSRGHEVKVLGVYSDLIEIKRAIDEFTPHVVFNLLEEFDGEVLFDQNVVSYLELLRVPYTGAAPRALLLCRDKSLAKKILSYHRIKTPGFCVFPKNRPSTNSRPKNLNYPMIVKCLTEEASLGIAQSSLVASDEKLIERVEYITKKLGVDAIAEEFVEGRELYVGVLGNQRLKVLPVWELAYDKVENPEKEIYSRRAKWNNAYRQKKGINTRKADLPPEKEREIQNLCKKIYKALGLTGYARIDLRLDSEGRAHFLEANPNPNVALDDEFALSAKHAKIQYGELIDQLLALAIK